MANPIAVPGTNVPSGAAVSPGGAQGTQGPVGTLPVGTVILYVAGGTPPASWMACDGSAVSRATYPDLFTAIGTTYGAGDGSTTFNLPDLRGRFPLGSGQGTGLTNRILAAKGGEETHQLVTAEMPSHVHNIGFGSLTQQTSAGGGAFAVSAGTVNTASTGGDGAHNTMPPFLALFYIIKVSASGGATAQAPIADTTQPGLMRTVSGNTTDFVDGTNNSQPLQPVIWSVRLRSVNILGNSVFEVDQANAGTSRASVPASGRMVDRWMWERAGSHQINSQQISELVNVPGTSFMITKSPLMLTLATAATLAAGDAGYVAQIVEGPNLRELLNDVHSVSILIKSTKANHKFSYFIQDPSGSRSYTKLCTIASSGTWTLVTIPNIPVFPPAGTWSLTPSSIGMFEGLCFGAGTTLTASADGAWSNGNFAASPGTDNWFSGVINTTQVEIAFIQHEPGALCTGFMDLDFDTNLSRCQRHFQKSYVYGTKPQTASVGAGLRSAIVPVGVTSNPVGPLNFLRTMAKTPTINIYAYDGSANNVTLIGGGNLAISSVMQPSDSGFQGIALSAAATAGQAVQFHYTADTGW